MIMMRLKQQQQQPQHQQKQQSWKQKSRTISLTLLSLGFWVLFSTQQHSFWRTLGSGERNSSSSRNIRRNSVFDTVVVSFSSTSSCCHSHATTTNTSDDDTVVVETHRNRQVDDDNDDTEDVDLKQKQDSLGCLSHEPIHINETQKVGADPTRTVLDHKDPVKCGRLRRQWLSNPVRSDFARQIQDHQSNCSLPLATHHFDNTFGMGSHLALWSQAMCNGMELGYRMISHAHEWIWLDQHHCNMHQEDHVSPLQCYFPAAESLRRCPAGVVVDLASNTSVSGGATNISNTIWADSSSKTDINITDPRNTKLWCNLMKTSSPETKVAFRASSTEYLIHKVSPLVIQEAQRQIGVIFPNGIVPDDIITVHVRWGDKFFEMDLPPISEYIDAVKNLTSDATTATIYLATEDPRAYQEFMMAKPSGWVVYTDITLTEINAFRPIKGNRASWATRNTKGRAGLIALASLLVAMEANTYVLTTKSNWSTLMNHLRMNIVDPRCGNCTKLVDLRPGFW